MTKQSTYYTLLKKTASVSPTGAVFILRLDRINYVSRRRRGNGNLHIFNTSPGRLHSIQNNVL